MFISSEDDDNDYRNCTSLTADSYIGFDQMAYSAPPPSMGMIGQAKTFANASVPVFPAPRQQKTIPHQVVGISRKKVSALKTTGMPPVHTGNTEFCKGVPDSVPQIVVLAVPGGCKDEEKQLHYEPPKEVSDREFRDIEERFDEPSKQRTEMIPMTNRILEEDYKYAWFDIVSQLGQTEDLNLDANFSQFHANVREGTMPYQIEMINHNAGNPCTIFAKLVLDEDDKALITFRNYCGYSGSFCKFIEMVDNEFGGEYFPKTEEDEMSGFGMMDMDGFEFDEQDSYGDEPMAVDPEYVRDQLKYYAFGHRDQQLECLKDLATLCEDDKEVMQSFMMKFVELALQVFEQAGCIETDVAMVYFLYLLEVDWKLENVEHRDQRERKKQTEMMAKLQEMLVEKRDGYIPKYEAKQDEEIVESATFVKYCKRTLQDYISK